MPAHPMVVHFPLALLISAALCLTLAWALPEHRYARTLAVVGTWNLCLGAFGVLFALGTGLAAVIDLQVGAAAHRAISMHAKSAVVTSCLVLLAAVWRCAGGVAESRPAGTFTLVLWAATVALIVTGYRGGENVYRYGVGVAPSRPAL